MAHLPPTVSDAVLMAAIKRGVTVNVLAAVLGVSRQRIDQRLRRFDEHFSAVRTAPRQPRYPVQCKYCGKWRWVTRGHQIKPKAEARRGNTNEYCSHQCAARANPQRRFTDADAVAAIALRHSGQTWQGIGRSFHAPAQSMQRIIWYYLRDHGMLTTATVARIWDRQYAGDRHYVSWQWLINRHGFAPSPRGAVKTR